MHHGTAVLVFLMSFVTLTAQSSDRFAAQGGDIIVTPIIHSSVQVEYDGKVIHIDPWSAGDLSSAKPADLILITDDPGHHLDLEAIRMLRKPGAPVLIPEPAQERFPDGSVLSNGEHGVFSGIPVESVAAYDLTPGLPFHPKGDQNGYVITLGGKRIFYAGVTECVPEIQALEAIDVAFMPMNSPNDRMRPVPVVECLKTFRPKTVYLNHYDRFYASWLGNRARPRPDLTKIAMIIQDFRNAIEGESIDFRDGDWYPPLPEP